MSTVWSQIDGLKRVPLSIGQLSESRSFKEVKYTCSTPKCGNTQVIRFFLSDSILPVTCCVQCRAGFEMPLAHQLAQHRGMFPGDSKVVQG
jgi:hypothetical protein